MTYLELVKALARASGTENPAEITDVTALETTHQEDVKNWIDRAYRDIQSMHEAWEFRRGALTVSLTAGTRSYALSSSAADFETLLPFYYPYRREYVILDDQRFNPVFHVRWRDWRGWYESQDDHEGRPRYFTVDPSDNLIVYPKPRSAYTLKSDYAKTLDTMTANDDEPIFPSRFHEVLVFYALREYAGYDEAAGQYQRADRSYKRLMNKMAIDLLPQTEIITP